MQQVEIHVVGLQALKLLIEKPVGVLKRLDHPDGQLGGDEYVVAQPARKSFANQRLARATVITIRSVDVVHALIEGVMQPKPSVETSSPQSVR